MKIYLAGKVGKNCWRRSLVGGLAEVDGAYPWPVLPKAVMGQWDYVGPFFTRPGHEPLQSKYPPTLVVHTLGDNLGGHGTATEFIRDYCLNAIRNADLVFAWLDGPERHGTLVEIGFAYALEKLIFVAGPPSLDQRELWFPLACETMRKRLRHPDHHFEHICQCFRSPIEALHYLRGLLDGAGYERQRYELPVFSSGDEAAR